jgi:hypothetical protein
MRFHLTYEGLLYGSSTAPHKHEIRKKFHPQLKRLWANTWLDRAVYGRWDIEQTIPDKTPLRDALASIHKLGSYRFVPLVRKQFSLLCSLNILFLRPDPPGAVIRSADIDNRLKTLFDALRTPTTVGELGGYDSPEADEDPFYCLLEDDKLISHISVATDFLLEPVEGKTNDVRLIVDVNVTPQNATMFNLSFAGSS